MKTILSRFFKYALTITLAITVLILYFVITILSDFPTQKQMHSCMTTKMYQIYLCPGTQTYVPLNQISPYIQKAIILTEDSAFWTHHGFDFDEIEKSLKKNIHTKKYARGGSTISQQLSKNLFLTEEKSLIRKLKEAIITLRLEKTLSKKEILEKYLNIVHLGKNIFGIKMAAEFYFKKSPSNLTVVESAFIAFLLPSPEKYSKSFYKAELTPFAETRLNQIIDNLYQYERITEQEYKTAKNDLKSLFVNKSSLESQSGLPVQDDSHLNSSESILQESEEDAEIETD